MPSRTVLALTCAFLLLTGGPIAAAFALGIHPRSMPAQPDELTNESVQSYVGTMEERKLYNEQFTLKSTDNDISCDTVVVARHENAFLLWVQCSGGVQYLFGSHSHTHDTAVYRVTDQVTERTAEDDTTFNKTTVGDGVETIRLGFRVVNFDKTAQQVNVTIGDAESEGRTFEYQLDSNTGVQQQELPYEFGSTHPITVQTNETTVTGEFAPVDYGAAVMGPNTLILVLPGGDIVIADIPPRESMGSGKW